MSRILNVSSPYSSKNLAMDSFLADFFDLSKDSVEVSSSIKGDIYESGEFFLTSFDLPGLDEEDINMEIQGSLFTLSGERKKNVGEEFKTIHSRSSYGAFKKVLELPQSVDTSRVEADYSQGVLKVLFLKKKESLPRKIGIQTKKGSLSNMSGKKSK